MQAAEIATDRLISRRNDFAAHGCQKAEYKQ
jgi:hypothetical protein